LKPMKDYDDYTKYVNEEFHHARENLVSKSNGFENAKLTGLRTQSDFKVSMRGSK